MTEEGFGEVRAALKALAVALLKGFPPPASVLRLPSGPGEKKGARPPERKPAWGAQIQSLSCVFPIVLLKTC